MLLVSFSKVQKDFGGNPVFKDIDLEILESERIGLVGENGSGKSTLFRLLADLDTPSQGVIARRRNLTIGYLEQELLEYSEAQERYEALGGYTFNHRVETVLQGLGFTASEYDYEVGSLSG